MFFVHFPNLQITSSQSLITYLLLEKQRFSDSSLNIHGLIWMTLICLPSWPLKEVISHQRGDCVILLLQSKLAGLCLAQASGGTWLSPHPSQLPHPRPFCFSNRVWEEAKLQQEG